MASLTQRDDQKNGRNVDIAVIVVLAYARFVKPQREVDPLTYYGKRVAFWCISMSADCCGNTYEDSLMTLIC